MVLSGHNLGSAFRSLLVCSASAFVATLIVRLTVRSARWQSLAPVARPTFWVGYALIGAAGFFAADAWLDAPLEAGLWGGLFLTYILDSMICRFVFSGNPVSSPMASFRRDR
jgi:hypothetical protein